MPSTGVEVAARCHRCGATTPDPRAFHGGRRGGRATCPPCAVRRARRTTGALLAVAAVALPLGLLGLVLGASGGVWSVLALFGGFYLLAEVQVVPHEAGHAVMARLVGFRVHRVQVGDGRRLITARLGRTALELHALPIGGVTWTSTTDPRGYRLRRTLIVAAGPAVTAVIALLAWRWTPPVGAGTDAVRSLLLVTSALVLVTNLIPYRTPQAGGLVPTDGLQLLTMPFLSEAEVRDQIDRAAWLEVFEQGRRGEWEGAVAGARAVVARDPGDPDGHQVLIHALIGAHRWSEAAPVARAVLASVRVVTEDGEHVGPSATISPTAVGVLWNDLASCLVMVGDDALRDEADEASARAMELVGWMPEVTATRGAVLVDLGAVAEGLALLTASMARLADDAARSRVRCYLAIGEAARGDHRAACHHIVAAERADAAGVLLPRARAAVTAAVAGRAE